ncbi:MAG: hypothetical protein COA36_10495 [Desulfotalea sp.]|nr:MAG: hypothetical protein COA36_10495 [Desulfotalea sp.]
MLCSLRNKFLLPTIFLIIVGMSALSIISYLTAKDSLKVLVVQDIQHIAEITAGNISSWIDDREIEINNLGKQRPFRQALLHSFMAETAREFLKYQLGKKIKRNQYYENVCLIDLAGDAVAVADSQAIEKSNVSDRAYFQRVKKGELYVGKRVVTSSATGNPVLLIASPVMDNEKIVGILLGVIKVEFLECLFFDPINLRKSELVYVFDADGLLIGQPPVSPSTLDIFAASPGCSVDTTRLNEGLAKGVVFGDKTITAFSKIEKVGWTVVVIAENDKILEPVKGLARLSLLVAFIVVCSVVVAIILVANTVSRPINDVVSGLKKMGEGSLDHRLNLSSNDEIGAIGQAVDLMAMKLEKSIKKINDQRSLLHKSNEEKEVLLRELYHRTKNNMLVIISLLKLQSEEVQDETLQSIFRETENRIRVMSLVHEKLCQSQNLSEIDIGNYLTDVATSLVESMTIDGCVDVTIQSIPKLIDIDHAIPLGIVVNEIITNSIKYAFIDKPESAVICITIQPFAPGKLEIVIADNGVGMPAGIDINSASSFGMQIISNLVNHQLGGTCEIFNDDGTTVRLVLPLSTKVVSPALVATGIERGNG